MSARYPLWDALEGPEGPGRVESDQAGGSRLTVAASQAARDLTRLQASRDAVASEVIAFQVARQRARVAAAADPDGDLFIPALSSRETEVLALLAAGRSDGEIADALFISKKTASVHVANIKGKLGAASRVEIALVARRLGLVDDSGAAPAQSPSEPAGTTAGRAGVVCPFKGLAAYEVADAAYYYGRERVVAEVIARLAASTFVAVVGSSGSGKSSLLRAGVVPAIQAGVLPGSDAWSEAIVRPGDHPLRALEAALRGIGTDARLDRADAPDEPGGSPNETFAGLGRPQSGGRLLLVVDQLEEAFTQARDAAERAQFFDALADLAGDRERRTLVVTALRGDFYGRCAEHPRLADLVGANTMLLAPMRADELARAIELPTRAAGLRLDADLAPLLVADVLSQPGGLPLLSATLLDLWQRRDGRTLRTETYHLVGGISGAVARLAEGALERLSADEQVIARTILLRLSTIGESGAVARRRSSLAELDAAREDVARVLDVLTERRLITVDGGQVDLAHEAILRDWPRMRRWLEDDAEGRRIRERLARAADDWAAGGRDPGELYRGQRLLAAAEWAAANDGALNENERAFLARSRDAAEAQLIGERQRSARLRRLLAGAAVLLVVAIVAGGLAIVQAGAASEQAALAASRANDARAALRVADAARTEADAARTDAEAARQAAIDAARLATSRRLIASSNLALARDPALSRLLAVAAADLGPLDVDAEAALHAAAAADVIARRVTVAEGEPLHAVVDPAASRAATLSRREAEDDEVVRVVDLADGSVAWTYRAAVPGVHLDPPMFSADGAEVLVATFWQPTAAQQESMAADGEPVTPPSGLGIVRLDASTGRVIGILDDGPCGTRLRGVTARWLLTAPARDGAPGACFGDGGDPGAGVGLLDPASGRRRWLAADTLGDAVISADGRVAAYSHFIPGQDGAAREGIVVATADGRALARIGFERVAQQDGGFHALSADGGLALFGDRPIAVLDTASGQVLGTIGNAEGEHLGFAFGTAGDVAYISGRDGSLRAWDVRRQDPLFTVPTAGSGAVSVSRDEQVLTTDFFASTLSLSQPRFRGELATVATCVGTLYPAGQLEVAHGTAILSGDCGDIQPTYAVATGTWQIMATMPDSTAQAMALSPDGSRVVRQTLVDGKVQPLTVHDTSTGRTVATLEGLCAWDGLTGRPEEEPGCRPFPATPFPLWASDLAYTPDGRIIVGTDPGGYLAAWDAGSGRLVATIDPGLPGHARGSVAMIVSPDGDTLAVSTEYGGVVTYSTADWRELARHQPVVPAVLAPTLRPMAYLDGGRTLLAGFGLGGLEANWLAWVDPTTFTAGRTMRLPERVKSYAVSPDGTLLATGGADGTVRVWDAMTGDELHRLSVPGQAQGVAFLDATTLMVTPHRGGIHVAQLDREQLLRQVRAGLTRGFTTEECARFGVDPCPTLDAMRVGPSAP